MYDWSHRYPIWFSSQTALFQIGLKGLVLVLMYTPPIQSVTSLSYLVFITYRTRFDQSQQFSVIFCVYCTRLLFTSLSFLVFITNYTLSNQSRQYSIVFGVDRTYMISHIVFPVWFSSQTTLGQIGPKSSVLVSTYTKPIQFVTPLSCVVFVIDCTQSDRIR